VDLPEQRAAGALGFSREPLSLSFRYFIVEEPASMVLPTPQPTSMNIVKKE
jgi:hypothetical protein